MGSICFPLKLVAKFPCLISTHHLIHAVKLRCACSSGGVGLECVLAPRICPALPSGEIHRTQVLRQEPLQILLDLDVVILWIFVLIKPSRRNIHRKLTQVEHNDQRKLIYMCDGMNIPRRQAIELTPVIIALSVFSTWALHLE